MNLHKPSTDLTLAISNLGELMHGCKASHRFTRQGGTLGSQQCDWQLLGRTRRIHPLHCEIRWREERFCIVDHCGETYMNASDLSLSPGTHVRLGNEDQLQIGDYVIVAYVDAPDGYAGGWKLNQQSLSELIDGNQCPLQALRHPLPAHVSDRDTTAPTDIDDLDPLIALEAATRRSQGTWLFADLFTPGKGAK